MGRTGLPCEAGVVQAVEARRHVRTDVGRIAGPARAARRRTAARCRGPDRADRRPWRDAEGAAPAWRRARRRGRVDGLSGPRHRLRLVASGLRDGLHVLRNGADGPAEQPDGGRDQRAGGLGAPRSGGPPREAARLPATTPQRLTNVVFMGMGEPLANQRHVFASLAQLTDPTAFGLGARHITVSTVGIVPGIERLAERTPQVGLAVSFHAASDELRDQLVPPNTRYPLQRLERAIADWRLRTRRRPSIEWALIDHVNDTTEQAELLAPIARRLGAHVNLIPLNPTPGYPVLGSPPARIRRFVEALERLQVNVTVRDTRGRSIDAACGQLALSTPA